jgi:hypothetical protein
VNRTCNPRNLKTSIRDAYQPPALENDGAVLNFMNDGERYSPRNDVAFREILQSLVSKSNFKFTVFIETPSKPFNEWTFPKVYELYGLSDDSNPSIDVYPIFSCGCVDTKNEKYNEALRKLFDELRLVLHQLLSMYPMRSLKAFIRTLISSLQLTRLKIKSRSY